MEIKGFIKKQWSNILFGIFLILLIIPQTRMPIQVFVQRLISFSPSETSEKKRETLEDYHWPMLTLERHQENLTASKDRVALINMWATWCPPCVAEMPSMQKLYDDYGDRVDFYFITSDDLARIDKFMTKNQYDLPIYLQTHDAPQKLESSLLPTTFVISKSGQIVVRETGSADWNSKKTRELLDKLLAE